MGQYKCVPAPKQLVIEKKGDFEKAVSSFSYLINREISDGWKFHSMENIAVTEKPGCFSALFGQKEKTVFFNMLIFVKD